MKKIERQELSETFRGFIKSIDEIKKTVEDREWEEAVSMIEKLKDDLDDVMQ
ncbi:MAG: hypothetical protein IJ716_06025 [Lachnospiraceae bacterium]|nr:hypothetical protein [Lachnospiraceae bacterium]